MCMTKRMMIVLAAKESNAGVRSGNTMWPSRTQRVQEGEAKLRKRSATNECILIPLSLNLVS